MVRQSGADKTKRLIIGLCITGAIFVIQLFRLQIADDEYKISAANNALRYETRYPSRGLILDRNGKILVGNKVTYDIMATPADLQPFDTLEFCRIMEADPEEIKAKFADFRKRRRKIGYQTVPLIKQADSEKYNRFAEVSFKFPGITAVSRSTRDYPYNACGNLLGYVSEVDTSYIRKNPEYRSGDYAGKTGIEAICEKELRGVKGYSIFVRDVHNRIQSSFENGLHDSSAVPGNNVYTTIDAELQNYVEEIMANKVGSVVAIEPETGEILALVSSPGISVDKLANINRYYNEIASDPMKPMFNRAVMSPYPPGSVFKILNGLIALQEGVLTPSTTYRCSNGYHVGNFTLKCHSHKPSIDMTESIMMSCNAYYCYVLRDILDNPAYRNIEESMKEWQRMVMSFGFGKPLGCDLPSEQGGTIPGPETYNHTHGKGRWKSLSVISLSIGQGEIGATPLQLANYAAILANRGYYRIPHILKEHADTADAAKFSEKRYTAIDRKHFDEIIPGMYYAVNKTSADGATAWRAGVKGLEICGKTGTAQNPHGKDHATFIGFAPKDNPRIAICVYIENAGFGGTWAAPVASLAIEKYLTGSISRPEVEKQMKEAVLNPYFKPEEKNDNR